MEGKYLRRRWMGEVEARYPKKKVEMGGGGQGT